MDHVCRTAAFDRHEYLGTRYNRARIRAMFRKVDGGESKRGQINKEGNGSSLSSLFIIQRAHIRLFPCSNRLPALHRFIVVQLESITGHARPYSNFFRQPSRAETLLSYSHWHPSPPEIHAAIIDRGKGGGREREIRCFDRTTALQLYPMQWRSILASGLIIVGMFRLM